MKRTSGLLFGIAALLASTLVLSGQTCDEGTAGQCVPGRIVPCPCPDGTDGLQECKDDKTYGECACVDAGGTQLDASSDAVEQDTLEDASPRDGGHDSDGSDAIEQPVPYRYVKITDMSSATSTENAGADIDAVELVKEGGQSHWAETIEQADLAGTPGSADVNEILGQNDAVWEDGTCEINSGYTSLGGSPGTVVVSFGLDVELEPGDAIRVYEVGNCDFGGGAAVAEEIRIEVGVELVDGVWPLVAGESDQSPVHTYVLTEDQLPPMYAD